MKNPRIKTTHAYGEVYPNVWGDFAWVREHRQQLLEQYGECIILVYDKQVVGLGQTIDEAIQDAEHQLSPEIEQITPITEFLRRRRLFRRIRSNAPENQ
jgi:recombinational DNA repair ATPase RecF